MGWKIVIAVLIFTSVVGTISGIYIKLNNTIEAQKLEIAELNTKLANAQVAIAIKDSNIKDLTDAIDKGNKSIEQLKNNLKAKQKEFTTWKKLNTKDKFANTKVHDIIESPSTNTCESIRSTIRNISNIKYEDLK